MGNEENLWYTSEKLDGHNALFNFVLGARGVGKSFHFKLKALRADWNDEVHQTIWIRRRGTDVDELLGDDKATKFLQDVFAQGKITWEEDEWKLENDTLYHFGHPIIFFIPLSAQEKFKSVSFHHVKRIVFDEVFTISRQTGRGYLKGEVGQFLELYETANRLRGVGGDTRPDIKVYFLANKVSWVNPYFEYWHITPFNKRFKRFAGGEIVVENYHNESFAKMKRQSRFGRLIEGTAYGDYAVENEAWADSDAFIAKRDPESKLVMGIRYGERLIGLWVKDGIVYCSDAINPNTMIYSLRYQGKDGDVPLTRGEPLKSIIEVFNAGKLRFETQAIKFAMFDIIQTGGNQ